MKYFFRNEKTSVDGKQDYQKHDVFLDWKDVKF